MRYLIVGIMVYIGLFYAVYVPLMLFFEDWQYREGSEKAQRRRAIRYIKRAIRQAKREIRRL